MTKNPHDSLFKHVFSQPEHAAGELQAVMDPALAARIDWGSLALCPGSFVDEALAQRHTDLLFSARIEGEAALLYVLFEHLSTSPPLGPYRMLQYEVKIWDDWIARNPAARKLPLILPVVLHHSESGWRGPVRFEEVMDVSPALLDVVAPHVPHFALMLDDISQISDEALRLRAMSALGRLALALLREARRKGKLFAKLRRFKDAIYEVSLAPDGGKALHAVLYYIWATSEQLDPGQVENLEKEIRAILQPHSEAFMRTAYEQMNEIYREEGIEWGTQRALRDTLLRLLEKRFGPPHAQAQERIKSADIPTLEACFDRILTAATVEEVLSGSPSPATA